MARPTVRSWLDQEQTLAWLLVGPLVLLLLGLVAYPFAVAVQFALSDRTLAEPGRFVGLANVWNLWDNQIYRQTLWNTIVYTIGATVLKLGAGLGLALILNERLPLKRLIRSAVLLPWIVPTVLSAMAWLWLLTPNFSVLNWILVHSGLCQRGLPWLTSPSLAMFSVILVNTWRGIPFFAITLLAGLQTIPGELYEASAIDGAGTWRRFRYVTLPLLQPILLITLVLSVIWTFSDFQVVYGLTQGGPMNSTHVLATLSYQVGLASGNIGEGAAISLTMLPLLLVLIIWQIRHLRRGVGRVNRRPAIERVLFVYAPLAFALVFLLGPFYWMVITALKPNSELYNAARSPLYVASPTLEHFVFLFRKTAFLEWTKNTMIVSVGATTLALTLGVPAGYALARFRFPGAGLVGTGVIVTYLVPTSLLFIPMVQVMSTIGLVDSYWALVVVYPTFLAPFVAWLMAGYFRTIPGELEECARIDGASRLGALWRIAIPLARPGIVSAGIFAFTLSWNEFIYALTLVTASSERTIPVGVLVQLTRADFYFWGPLMAGALAGSIPVALIYSFFVDQYAAGLTAGAVKG